MAISSLWKSCDELRGIMDASQYKNYVLVLLFIKSQIKISILLLFHFQMNKIIMLNDYLNKRKVNFFVKHYVLPGFTKISYSRCNAFKYSFLLVDSGLLNPLIFPILIVIIPMNFVNIINDDGRSVLLLSHPGKVVSDFSTYWHIVNSIKRHIKNDIY